MCKLLIIPTVNDTAKVKKFMKAAVPDFTKYDHDGIGYAAMQHDGSIFIERWLNVSQAFKDRSFYDKKEAKALGPIKNSIDGYFAEPVYNKQGVDTDKWSSVVYHSRMATCGVSLANTHPFVSEDTVLAHNGVISKSAWKNETTTCDSEMLLHGFNDLGVKNNPDSFELVHDALTGYYALGVYSKNTAGTWHLDVIKDDRAKLEVIYVSELDSIVYCTDASIIKDTCRLLDWGHGPAYKIKDFTYIRHDALTGEVLDQLEYKSPWTYEADKGDSWDTTGLYDAEDFDAESSELEYEDSIASELDLEYEERLASDIPMSYIDRGSKLTPIKASYRYNELLKKATNKK